MRRYSRWLRWVNVGVIFLTFLAYLSPLVSPARFWPLSFFGLLYPTLLLVNLTLLIGWLFLRRAYFLLSLGAILLGWPHLTSLVGLRLDPAPAGAQTATLTVMSFNCHGFRHTDRRGQQLSVEQLSAWLEKQRCDVLCLQEFDADQEEQAAYREAVKSALGLPYFYPAGEGELAIFSRFPMRQVGNHYFENQTNGYQYGDLPLDGRTIRLYNVHLQSNSISSLADKVATQGKLQERETWLDIKGMLGRFRRANRLRARQAEELVAHLGQATHPVVLAGDFNDIPQSYAYHQITRRLQDAFRAGALGWGTTYTGKIPGLRIDYIFCDPGLGVHRYERGKANFSDHRPVSTVLVLEE